MNFIHQKHFQIFYNFVMEFEDIVAHFKCANDDITIY